MDVEEQKMLECTAENPYHEDWDGGMVNHADAKIWTDKHGNLRMECPHCGVAGILKTIPNN